MKIKKGVSLVGIQLPMRKVFKHADRIWKKYEDELVITSCTDGVHSAASYHPFGYALDLRTRNFSHETARSAADKLRCKLGHCYTVILESDHIHVQFNI